MATYTVKNSGGDFTTLQAAVNAVVLGDTIVVEAGQTFTGTTYLPDKGAGTSYITIKSSLLANLPADRRVFPADVSNMPKLIGNGSGSGGGSNQPVVGTDVSAHHYKFQGIEITCAIGNSVKSVVEIHGAGQSAAAPTLAPHHIIIDRCYIHSAGATDTTGPVRGIALNGKFCEVRNSWIGDIHGNSTDAQGIFAWAGPGEMIIDNNYIEATSECLQLGYGDLSWTPDNVTITHNHISRPLAWRGNGNYANVKNLFEMKGGTNVLFEGNVLENNWADGQSGMAFAIKNYYNEMHHVIMRNNLIRHVGAGLSLSSDPTLGPISHDITFSNNLIIDMDASAYDNPFTGADAGGYFLLIGATEDAVIDHNTEAATGGPIDISGNDFVIAPGTVFTNNISGTVTNITIMMTIFNNGGAMHKNVRGWIGGHSGTDQVFGYENVSPTGPEPPYPQVTMWNSLNGSVFWFLDNDYSHMGFQDYPNQDYRLSSGSLYKGAGDGGSDVGVNYSALIAAIGADSNALATATISAITGVWEDVWTPPNATLTTTTFAPTILLSGLSATPTTATLTATTFAPTILISGASNPSIVGKFASSGRWGIQ